MSKLLDDAINKVKQLSETEQDNIARLILDEVVWDDLLDKTKGQLSILAEKALKDFNAGKTGDLKF